MKTPAERLQQFIDYKALRVSKFEKEIGAGNATIGKILAEKREISSDIVKKILKAYPELNRDWLLFEEGGMILEKFRITENTSQDILQENRQLREEISEVRKALDRAKDEIIELLKKYNK